MHRLQCVAQQYDWGKKGSSSAVARFANAGEGRAIDEGKPYAEYWFGTHASGPSKLIEGGQERLLHDWLLVSRPHAVAYAPQLRGIRFLRYRLCRTTPPLLACPRTTKQLRSRSSLRFSLLRRRCPSRCGRVSETWLRVSTS